MMRLTQEQKKIYTVSAIVGTVFFMVWLFIIIPQNKKLAYIKTRLKDSEAKIQSIAGSGGQEGLVATVEGMNAKLQKLSQRFSLSPEEVVKNLSEKARVLRITVKNINFSQKIPYPKDVPFYSVDEMPVVLSLVCEYRALGEYLIALRESFPAVVTVRQLSVRGKGEGVASLDVELQLSAYLGKEKPSN